MQNTIQPTKELSRRQKYFQDKADSWRRTRDERAERIRGIKAQFPDGKITDAYFASLAAQYERERANADREMMRALFNAGRTS